VIADAVERGGLSATTERLVRPPGAKPSVERSDVAAPRARPFVVRDGRPVIRAHARGRRSWSWVCLPSLFFRA